MSSPSNLEEHTGFWLRKLSNHVSASFEHRLRPHDVSVANWVVLRTLYPHEALPLKDIVSRVGVDQGALSRMIERLVARGLVAQRESPASRREVSISLTNEGRRLVPKLASEADENDRAFFGRLTARERAAFDGSVKTLLAMSPIRGTPID
jgi:DNA-binding MarR family transcriptional regulator